MSVTFQRLGPIDAGQDGRSLPLSGPRRRALLARLLLARGQPVSVDQLVEDIWDGQPTAAAGATLQSHVSQLRKVFGDRLRSRGRGYMLDLSGASLDAAEFEALADRGAAQLTVGEPAAAHAAFEAAVALWRGRAFGEVADRVWAGPEAARLVEPANCLAVHASPNTSCWSHQAGNSATRRSSVLPRSSPARAPCQRKRAVDSALPRPA
jgi:DNA-binding SARP family transcriptional activator